MVEAIVSGFLCRARVLCRGVGLRIEFLAGVLSCRGNVSGGVSQRVLHATIYNSSRLGGL